jgi:hypothetical protein
MNTDAPSRSIDGIRHPAPAHAAIVAVPRPAMPGRRLQFKPPAATKKQRRWERWQLPFILSIGLFGGYIAQSLLLGLGMLIMYALAALVWRIPSRTTFMLALLFLLGISLLLLLRPNQQLVSNFATYAFVLLLIGVITLGREARLPKRIRPSRRR